MEDQRHGAEDQSDRQHVEADLTDHAQEELPEHAAPGKAAEDHKQGKQDAHAAPDLPAEF